MAFFEWKDTYSVGVPVLDSQHRVLIEIINELHDLERQHGDIRGVLDQLDWYVREHFSLEEKMLKQAGYPDFDLHVMEHRAFEKWLRDGQFHLRVTGEDMPRQARAINAYLKTWLTKHILVNDMDYKALLSSR